MLANCIFDTGGCVGDVAPRRRGAHVAGIVEDIAGQQATGGAYQDQLAMSGENDPAQRPLVALAERFGQHLIRTMGGQSIGAKIEAAAGKEHRVDMLGIEKALQAEGAVLDGAQPVQFVGVDDDVTVGRIGVAFDDGGGFDGSMGRAALFIANALAAVGMELMEVHRAN